MDFYGDCGSNKLSFNGEVSGFEDLLDSDVWTPSSPTEQNVSEQSFIFREKETPPFFQLELPHTNNEATRHKQENKGPAAVGSGRNDFKKVYVMSAVCNHMDPTWFL